MDALTKVCLSNKKVTLHLHPHLHLKKIKSENAQKLEIFNVADNSVGAGRISVLGLPVSSSSDTKCCVVLWLVDAS